jgi:hypothetical protein
MAVERGEDNDIDVARDALLDWLAVKESVLIPIIVTIELEDMSHFDGVGRAVEILNYATFLTENMMIYEMRLPKDLAKALEKGWADHATPFAARVMVGKVRRGSIILEGALYFAIGAILKAVIGKPANEAWKSSTTRKMMVNGMRNSIDKAGELFANTMMAITGKTDNLSTSEVSWAKKDHIDVKIKLTHPKGKKKSRPT